VQCLDWPLVFLPFSLSRRGALVVNSATSLFLFVTYTVWSGGWPWWYADVAVTHPLDGLVTVLGMFL
jgi:hypothetical protein